MGIISHADLWSCRTHWPRNQICCRWEILWLTLNSIDTYFNASTTDSFRKHCGKRRNFSKRAISSISTMFSTQSENCIPICQYFWHHIFICCWSERLIELNGALRRFQQYLSYHRNSWHYSCLSWVSPVLGWGSEVSCLRTLPPKTRRIQSGSNPGPLDYESNTLPLSHAGPLKWKSLKLASEVKG